MENIYTLVQENDVEALVDHQLAPQRVLVVKQALEKKPALKRRQQQLIKLNRELKAVKHEIYADTELSDIVRKALGKLANAKKISVTYGFGK